MKQKMWDGKSSPNKANVRWEKILDICDAVEGSKATYLGLSGPQAILETELAATTSFDPDNMHLLEKKPEVYKELISNISKGPLKGCHAWREDFSSFVESYPDREGLPKFSAIDCDFCGLPSPSNLNTIVNLAKNGLLATQGILFVNFCKGHDKITDVNSMVSLDKKLKESLRIKKLTPKMTKAGRKPYLDKFREMFIPKYLIRQFANHGYHLSVNESLCEYTDGHIYMHQWTFSFKKIESKASLVSYKANMARPGMKAYVKRVLKRK